MDNKKRNRILVLKAFQLGNAISRHHERTPLLEVIDNIIKDLEKRDDQSSKLRLLFYVLLKAEINRDNPNVLETRKYAQILSSELDSKIYQDFMLIENETININKPISQSKSIQTACRALRIDINEFEKSELNFLENTNLSQMLKAHGIKGD
jgi:hypothetical protein